MVIVHKHGHLPKEQRQHKAVETDNPQDAVNDLKEIRVDDDLQEPDPEGSYEPTQSRPSTAIIEIGRSS